MTIDEKMLTITTQNSVENRETAKILLQKMQQHGIERNCQDYRQYAIAKRLVGYISEDSQEFENLIRVVVDYINI